MKYVSRSIVNHLADSPRFSYNIAVLAEETRYRRFLSNNTLCAIRERFSHTLTGSKIYGFKISFILPAILYLDRGKSDGSFPTKISVVWRSVELSYRVV